MPKPWELCFPQIGSWVCHSPRTRRYNCYAFAAGDDTRRWEPDPYNQYYWPSGVIRDYTLDAFIEAYRTIGYELCPDGSLDSACEKIVMYVGSRGIVEHVARQGPDGRWISKLGEEEDIIHRTPDSLTSADYGRPVCFMARAVGN